MRKLRNDDIRKAYNTDNNQLLQYRVEALERHVRAFRLMLRRIKSMTMDHQIRNLIDDTLETRY